MFLICTCCGFLFSCSEFGMPDDDLADLELKKASVPAVFLVEPSGGDDTPALMQAFEDAKVAGPGSVVQLCEGEYHLGFIEIRDFCGSLKGAGKGKTIITAMDNLDIDPLFARGVFPALIKFVGGEVMICHFTIQTPPGRISVGGPGWGHITSLFNFSANNADYEPFSDERSITVGIDHVCMKGQRVEEGGYPYYNYRYNCGFAIWTGGDFRLWEDDPVPRQKIDIAITNCEFNTFSYGFVIQDIKNSKITIGEKNKGNTFNNLDRSGGLWEGRDNEFVAEGNTVNVQPFSWGFVVDDYPYYPYLKDEPPTKKSLINIKDNVFNLDHADIGLYLRNIRNYYFEDISMAIQVKNNQFNMTDGYEWAIGSLYTDGMVIRNNKFNGHGDLALWLVNYSKNGLALGNNFSTASFETGVAYLTETTQNWTFVGGNFKDKVIDLGVNNVFTGMNVSTADEPLGRSISEKLVPMNHLMK
jgi:hypothetical protein